MLYADLAEFFLRHLPDGSQPGFLTSSKSGK